MNDEFTLDDLSGFKMTIKQNDVVVIMGSQKETAEMVGKLSEALKREKMDNIVMLMGPDRKIDTLPEDDILALADRINIKRRKEEEMTKEEGDKEEDKDAPFRTLGCLHAASSNEITDFVCINENQMAREDCTACPEYVDRTEVNK